MPRTDDIIWQDYQRHESRPAEKLLELLVRLEAGDGGGAGEHARVHYRCERRHPTPISWGPTTSRKWPPSPSRSNAAALTSGRSSNSADRTPRSSSSRKRKKDDRGKTVSMNDKCAGGTGVVIDKISAKLKVTPDALKNQPFLGLKVYPIAGKCGGLRRDRYQRPPEARPSLPRN